METEPSALRIIVTGSRYCSERWQEVFVEQTLNRVLFPLAASARVVLVVGESPYGGVDMVARRWAERSAGRIAVDPFPADWSRGSAAGPIRNRQMAEAGAFPCLGFPAGKSSRGTWGMLREAAEAGIPCRVYPLPTGAGR